MVISITISPITFTSRESRMINLYMGNVADERDELEQFGCGESMCNELQGQCPSVWDKSSKNSVHMGRRKSQFINM